MPSIFNTPLYRRCPAAQRAGASAAAGAIAAMLSDAGVLAFKPHIAQVGSFGHRGATHSIAFALLPGLAAFTGHRRWESTPWRSAGFVAWAALSHPLPDACTDGGFGA